MLTHSVALQTVSVTPAQWFAQKRGLATGIVYAAGGLGGTIIAFMFDGLIQRLG
jgi:nitrate/nitrite transporter NarK